VDEGANVLQWVEQKHLSDGRSCRKGTVDSKPKIAKQLYKKMGINGNQWNTHGKQNKVVCLYNMYTINTFSACMEALSRKINVLTVAKPTPIMYCDTCGGDMNSLITQL